MGEGGASGGVDGGGSAASGSTGAATAEDAKAEAARESARAASGRNTGPPLLVATPADPDAALAESVVTGAGSEEIWRKHIEQPQKVPEGKP